MTTCEFKKECDKIYPEEWKNCNPKVVKECQIRKFAILVVNRWVEKVILLKEDSPDAILSFPRLEALKMEQD